MVGLLWFDDDPNRDLKQKVGNAAKRYTEKFGHPPTVCYVHPSALGDGAGASVSMEIEVSGRSACLRVVPRRSVLRNHFWVGVGELE